MKRNRYHRASARTVSARCLSAILALEIVVRRIILTERERERELKKRLKQSESHTEHTHIHKGSAASADPVPETLSARFPLK